ncbi:CRTAC1 family protein [Acidobacteria bacterium AH-259-O06]|nr:CRTAC1 family protein [Acidobacteria bacterium AH-259-O06]
MTEEVGIRFRHENGQSDQKYMVETFGSGVAWLDYDNDGYLDLYFSNGANVANGQRSPGNILLRNTGKGTFVDVTEEAKLVGNGKYATGIAVGDYNNDGLLDLFVTTYGPNLLFRNNGDGTFSNLTAQAALAGDQWSSSAGFFDYDRDGDLDLYVVNYLDYRLEEDPYCGFQIEGYRTYCDPTVFDGSADQLYRNNGDGTFSDVSVEAGIANPSGKGLGVTFGDFDQDDDVDIYVANDLVRNFLYQNNGDGSFSDMTYTAGVGYDLNGKPQAGMGVDSGDFDGDGLLDIFVTNFSEELNALYRNQGDFTFQEVSQGVGLGSGLHPLGFGTRLFDFDNDGDLDIYVTNGHVIDNVQLYHPQLSYAQKALLYENLGARFRDVSSASGTPFEEKVVGRGAAFGDFDNDGDVDIVVATCGQGPILMRNDGGNRNHWISISARGRESNHFGLGAKVIVETKSKIQLKEINNVASYLSSHDIRLHFGLGQDKTVKRIEITWPSGKKQTLKDLPADQFLLVEEP